MKHYIYLASTAALLTSVGCNDSGSEQGPTDTDGSGGRGVDVTGSTGGSAPDNSDPDTTDPDTEPDAPSFEPTEIYAEPGANTSEFVHPGISHKKSDLDRMKHMVEAEKDPWYGSYQRIANDSKSDFDYQVQGDASMTEVGRDNRTNYGAWNSDSRAAYYNALRWYIEGDERHAQKAVEIFNAWVGVQAVTSNGTRALSGGVGHIMIEAAELIKSTYEGWSTEDQQAFKDMLVYPGYSNTEAPDDINNSTFYWQAYQGDSGRHGNQGLSGWRTVMAMGIFLDNRIMYDRARRYILGLPHRDDDLPYPSGPPTSTALLDSGDYADTYRASGGSEQEDYGFNEVMTHYIWDNGQCQESSRDAQHTFFGLGLLSSMAEMAWSQGDDLYSHEDDRLLLGLEYTMRYNVSFGHSYPDQPSPWVPTVESNEFIEGFDRTGRWFSKAMSPIGAGDWASPRPVFEMPVAHYIGRGFKTEDEAKWILRARDIAIDEEGFEGQGWSNDALGWGGLSARRCEGCVGDPIAGFDLNGLPVYAMHSLPGTIQAANYDYSPVNGEGRTYSDSTPNNLGEALRNEEGVDLGYSSEGGYQVEQTAAGEWLTYTVNVPNRGTYDISLRYAAAGDGAQVRVLVANDDKTGAVSLPATGGSQTWQDLHLATEVELEKGVQSLKVQIDAGGFNWRSLTVD